jgi:hypothetical protein
MEIFSELVQQAPQESQRPLQLREAILRGQEWTGIDFSRALRELWGW